MQWRVVVFIKKQRHFTWWCLFPAFPLVIYRLHIPFAVFHPYAVTSASFCAEIPVRSPRKLFIVTIQNYIYSGSKFQTTFHLILKTDALDVTFVQVVHYTVCKIAVKHEYFGNRTPIYSNLRTAAHILKQLGVFCSMSDQRNTWLYLAMFLSEFRTTMNLHTHTFLLSGWIFSILQYLDPTQLFGRARRSNSQSEWTTSLLISYTGVQQCFSVLKIKLNVFWILWARTYVYG